MPKSLTMLLRMLRDNYTKLINSGNLKVPGSNTFYIFLKFVVIFTSISHENAIKEKSMLGQNNL